MDRLLLYINSHKERVGHRASQQVPSYSLVLAIFSLAVRRGVCHYVSNGSFGGWGLGCLSVSRGGGGGGVCAPGSGVKKENDECSAKTPL